MLNDIASSNNLANDDIVRVLDTSDPALRLYPWSTRANELTLALVVICWPWDLDVLGPHCDGDPGDNVSRSGTYHRFPNLAERLFFCICSPPKPKFGTVCYACHASPLSPSRWRQCCAPALAPYLDGEGAGDSGGDYTWYREEGKDEWIVELYSKG